MTAEEASVLIKMKYPELPRISIEAFGSRSQHHDLFLIDRELVFRFNRFEESIDDVRRERELLFRLQGLLSLATPNPIYFGEAGEDRRSVFLGYPKILGQPLSAAAYAKLDGRVARQIAMQLGEFLTELHALSPQEFSSCLPVRSGRAWAESLYERVQSQLFSYMNSDSQLQVRARFDSLLARTSEHPYTLQHGDFGGGNILFSVQHQTVTGVIDFSTMVLGDPAVDIAAISTLGERFFEFFLSCYRVSSDCLERADCYRQTFALQEALYGLHYHDNVAFEAGIADFR